MPWKIEVDCDDGDGERTKAIVKTEFDRGVHPGKRANDETAVESTKTFLVPVRDPVTRQVKSMLVPVEVKDESGLHIMKSVLIPVHGGDGLVSYEIKRVLVPIQPVLNISQRKQSDTRPGMNKNKWKQASNKNTKDTEENRKLQAERRKKQRIKRSGEEKGRTPEGTEKSVPAEDILDTLHTTCPFCEKRYRDVDKMQKHVSKVHRKPYSCDKCCKGYFTEYALQEHQKKHEVASFYQCSICQLQYKTTSGLKNHRIRAHADLKPNFMCDYCGKRFILKLDLVLHINRSHMNTTHICRFCGMAVKNISHHELKHIEARQPPPSLYCCELCPRTFKARNSLENHLLMKHNGSKGGPDMLRTLCEKPFESRNDFYQHLHNRTEATQHKCDVCGKICANEENLRCHVTLHSQSFLCPHCGKVFSTNYSRKLHLRVHTGERPYQCKECLKSFSRTTSLTVHELTHTGQRPYVCDICGQKFTQRSSMMVHRRKHPGNHPPPPPMPLSKRKNNEH